MALAASMVSASPAPSPDADSADLTLGGIFILRLWGGMAHMTARERVGEMESRLSPILGNAMISPEDVVVFSPKKPPCPVIYVFGRRFATVDTATAKANGGTPEQVAVKWAKRLQQVLPKLNWRPSNAPEIVVPIDPPLTVTELLAEVGGTEGVVTIKGKEVIRFSGVQPGGMTAAERADIVQARLNQAIVGLIAGDETAVRIAASRATPNASELIVNNAEVVEVTPAMASDAQLSSSDALAGTWKSNILSALGPSPSLANPTPPGSAPSTEGDPVEPPVSTPAPPPAP
jgi:hypothetical protein